MTPLSPAALIADVAAICAESIRHDAAAAGVEVVVRYSGYMRNAVIQQTRMRPSTRRRTRGGRPYTQAWRVVEWLDGE